MIIDICNRMGNSLDTIDQIILGINIYGILCGMTSGANVLIKTSLLSSFAQVLAIIFNGINWNLDKLNKFERGYGNNNDIITIIIITNIHKISILVLVIVVTFLLFVIYLTMQAMDESSLHIPASITFELIIVAQVPLVSNLGKQLSIDAVNRDAQVIHNVCGAQYFMLFFRFFCIIFFVFFFNFICLVKKIITPNIRQQTV